MADKTLQDHKNDLRAWLLERGLELDAVDPILINFSDGSDGMMLTGWGSQNSRFPERELKTRPHGPTKSEHSKIHRVGGKRKKN